MHAPAILADLGQTVSLSLQALNSSSPEKMARRVGTRLSEQGEAITSDLRLLLSLAILSLSLEMILLQTCFNRTLMERIEVAAFFAAPRGYV
jgi:hypothetical protein